MHVYSAGFRRGASLRSSPPQRSEEYRGPEGPFPSGNERHQADISGFFRLLAAKGIFEREQAVAHARCGNGRMLAASFDLQRQ